MELQSHAQLRPNYNPNYNPNLSMYRETCYELDICSSYRQYRDSAPKCSRSADSRRPLHLVQYRITNNGMQCTAADVVLSQALRLGRATFNTLLGGSIPTSCSPRYNPDVIPIHECPLGHENNAMNFAVNPHALSLDSYQGVEY